MFKAGRADSKFKVKAHANQVDDEHRQSRSFLWGVEQANAALDVQIKRMQQELAAEACPQYLSQSQNVTESA